VAGQPKQHLVVSDPDKRIIAGFASVEVKDLQNDIIPVSVLERAMYDFMERGGPIIYGHSNIPVGKVLRWEIREHPETKKPGLWIEAEIYRGAIPADQLWEEIKAGKMLGFSIGGVGKEEKVKIKSDDGKEDIADLITFLQLMEISVVDTPANPHARIEYVNYMAKSADDYSKCLNEVGGDKVDFCKWISAVYHDYGFKDVSEAIKAVSEMLEGKKPKPESTPSKEAVVGEAKDEGSVTTSTPGAYNPVYGDKPSAQTNLEQNIAGSPRKPKPASKVEKAGDDEKEEPGETEEAEEEEEEEEAEADLEDEENEENDEEESEPDEENGGGEPDLETTEPPPELPPEPSEEESEISSVIRRLIGELRELLSTIREVKSEDDEESEQG